MSNNLNHLKPLSIREQLIFCAVTEYLRFRSTFMIMTILTVTGKWKFIIVIALQLQMAKRNGVRLNVEVYIYSR